MDRIILLFALFAVLAVPAAAQDEVHLVPPHSTVPVGNTIEVEIRVNATDFQSGQISLIYDPVCANVTNCVLNTATFPISGWDSSVDGREWITFMALSPLTGEYRIGTLTIHCICEDECETALDFVDPSALFDSSGGEVPANWINGTFKCTIIDTTPPSVTGPAATPESIAADGIQTTQLNVTVTDDLSGVDTVTVNLSAIGGSPTQAMTPIAGDVYTTTTTAAVGTEPATYCLSVNATDNFGNSNTTECIILDVAEPVEYGVDLNVDVIKQTVAPDENATYVLTVLNIGSQHDSFTLNITINEADTGELSKTFVSLAPGASETVHLIVSDSTDGVYNTTIEAVLEGDPSKKDAVTVETTVETEAVTTISIDDAIASTGGNDDVTQVLINNVVNVGVVRIDIHYGPSVVWVVDVADGDFDFITSSIDNAAGVVRIGAMQVASSGLSGDVLLAEVTLQAKGAQGNTSALSIDIKELKDATPQCNPIQAGVEDGIFTVSCLCGDVNEDGNVLLDDAMYLMKHCVEEPGFEQINECASDVNCDGAIEMADAMYLAKHCVGVQGFEKLHCCAG